MMQVSIVAEDDRPPRDDDDDDAKTRAIARRIIILRTQRRRVLEDNPFTLEKNNASLLLIQRTLQKERIERTLLHEYVSFGFNTLNKKERKKFRV